MPGPSPAPTKLKLLKGVKPYRINQNEPKPKSVSGNIPRGWGAHMSDIAKRFWKANAPRLVNAGVLTEADLHAFRVLCGLYSDYIKLTNIIKKVGMTYLSGKLPKKRPEVAILEKVVDNLLKYFAQFGMVPSGRSKIALPPDIPVDDGDLD